MYKQSQGSARNTSEHSKISGMTSREASLAWSSGTADKRDNFASLYE